MVVVLEKQNMRYITSAEFGANVFTNHASHLFAGVEHSFTV